MNRIAATNPDAGFLVQLDDASACAARYAAAAPFPHLVIDGFLPRETAEAAFAAFPSSASAYWREHGRFFSHGDVAAKYEARDRDTMPGPLQTVVDLINSDAVVTFLRALTGFDDLAPDASLMGGGLNLVTVGGRLKAHADFNFSNDLQAYRTVNLIYYLNTAWAEADGGCLDLWDAASGTKAASITPLFNRAAIFNTNSRSLHGYDAVTPAAREERKSVNFYFYSRVPRAGVRAEPHKTLWLDG